MIFCIYEHGQTLKIEDGGVPGIPGGVPGIPGGSPQGSQGGRWGADGRPMGGLKDPWAWGPPARSGSVRPGPGRQIQFFRFFIFFSILLINLS